LLENILAGVIIILE